MGINLRGRELQIPIIQGGMGVGVSMGRLAGSVAACGAIGIISSVNIGYREPDFETDPWGANIRALEKEIRKAREIAGGKGLIGVNIMTAVNNYEETCRAAVRCGADLIISGAGLPLKLPEYVKGSNTMFAPIVSSARAAKLLLRSYKKKFDVQPDLIVIEGHEAGGHLGFSHEDLAEGTYQDNMTILKEVLEETGSIPVFVGGGVFGGNDMAALMKAGASGVQIGTRFIATDECDASDGFKEVIVNAGKEDIRIIHSPVGMAARAVDSPLLRRLDSGEKFPPVRCNNCLVACPKGLQTPYCISRALIEAVKGNYNDGLFFTGSNAYRIDKILSVKDLIESIVEEYRKAIE